MNKAAYELTLRNLRANHIACVHKKMLKDIQVRHGNTLDNLPMLVEHVGKDQYQIRLVIKK
jgi:hypothetical protein